MDGAQTLEKMQKLARQTGGVLLSVPGNGLMVAGSKANAQNVKNTRNVKCDGCGKSTSDFKAWRGGSWQDLCSACF